MNKRGTEVASGDRIVPDRIVLGMAALLCLGSVLFLSWLLWRHHAVNQALLIVTAGGGQLSFLARISVALSNWSIRLFLPVFLVGAGGVAGFILAFFAWRWVRTKPRTATLCTGMFLGIGLVVAFASCVIVVSTYIPFELVEKLTPSLADEAQDETQDDDPK